MKWIHGLHLSISFSSHLLVLFHFLVGGAITLNYGLNKLEFKKTKCVILWDVTSRKSVSMHLHHFYFPGCKQHKTTSSKMQLADFSALRSNALQQENTLVTVLTGGEKWKTYRMYMQAEKCAYSYNICVPFTDRQLKGKLISYPPRWNKHSTPWASLCYILPGLTAGWFHLPSILTALKVSYLG